MWSVLLLEFFCVFSKGPCLGFSRVVGFCFCPFLLYRFDASVYSL